jgi:pyruvate/2-oxoglutarate dehydrogenase complex dihydrolipoamide acyltransferase (E2) component
MSSLHTTKNIAFNLSALLAVLLLTTASLRAQSLDPNTPAPIRTNTVNARIAARDLGDSRLTDHYFAFNGTPGDLLITVQSQNLNGDIDVFTAGTLRPLLKLTLYAESSAPIIKGIYLRKHEELILRVEARSPNDDAGTYRLTFSGSFEPIVGGPDISENETPSSNAETSATGRGTKRVSSVGATIYEPAPPPAEVAAAPTPAPTPAPRPEAKPEETPKPETAKTTPPRTARSPRHISVRRTPPKAKTTTPKSTDAAQKSDEPETKPAEDNAAKPEAKREPARAAEPEAAPEVGPRLVIETKDGTLINRPMSGIRRVTVENGQVVVVGRNGKIDRYLLADVTRMSISP